MKHYKHQVKSVSGNQYYKDKNGRWRDKRGRFVSAAVAAKS